MSAGPLTDEGVRKVLVALQSPERLELVDAAVPGLRLRSGSAGARWSLLTKGPDGEKVRIPLGAWPKIDVAQARILAGALRSTLADLAKDDEAALSVRALLARYEARRLCQLRKGRVMKRALESTLAPILHRPVQDVTRREIGRLIDTVAERAPIHANRVLAYTKALFNWAVGRGYLEQSPAASILKPTRERSRDRTPTIDELVDIWDAAAELGYPFGPIIHLLILTAGRRDEVGGMQLSELPGFADHPGRAGSWWTLPPERSKNGRAIRIPLSEGARQLLEQALAQRPEAGRFVFTTTGTTAVSGWSKAKARLDRRIAFSRAAKGLGPISPWRLHDLRRSFATYACDVLHIDPAVADRCLNHVGAATTSTVSRIYARNELFDQRREALDSWSAFVAMAVRRSSISS